MTRTGGLVLAAAIAGVLSMPTGATGAASGSAGGWTLAAYVCADGDLRGLGQAYVAELERGARAGGWTLALQIDKGAGAGSAVAVRRLIPGGGEAQTVRVGGDEPMNAGRSESLAGFLRWAGERAPGTRLGLIVFGHGASPAGLSADGGSTAGEAAVAFDADCADALTVREVVDALAAVDGTAELLALDSCFGCSADVVWELRGRVGVLVASPGRVPGSGLPWGAILSGRRPEAMTPEALAQGCLDEVSRSRESGEGLTAMRCAGLVEVAGAVRELCTAIATQPEAGMVELAVARRLCRDLGPEREMCDLRELCVGLRDSRSAALRGAAVGVAEAIDGCVLGRLGGGAGAGGLTVVMPGGLTGVVDDYGARVQGFAGGSGWGELVRAHCRGLQGLMRRTTGNPRRGEDAA